jgi:hypothetical protein
VPAAVFGASCSGSGFFFSDEKMVLHQKDSKERERKIARFFALITTDA